MEYWTLSDDLKKRKKNLIANGYQVYCLFCLSGIEMTLAKEINNNYEDVLALPILRMMHRSRNGNHYDSQEPLLSCYIFLYVPTNYNILDIKASRFFFKLLNKDNDNGVLYGSDLSYAEWVLEMEGLISISEAIKKDGKVVIISGPLKKLEGNIIEYSRRNRNCCVEIELLNQKIKTWLPFDWIDVK